MKYTVIQLFLLTSVFCGLHIFDNHQCCQKTEYTPPNNGMPDSQHGSGTRWC